MTTRTPSWLPLSLSPTLPLVILLSASAQPPPDDPPGRWQLETLTLRDQTTIAGLIQTQNDAEIDFAQIVQPPGKAMYAVIRGVARQDITKIQRLDQSEHLKLFERFALFRNRAVIEAGRMEQVELTVESDGLHYRGAWFTLVSTADDEQTRRSVVRIEQFFRAYRTLLPSRVNQPRPLKVLLFGSLDQYLARLRELDLTLDNAAFYSPREATILAGSDLNLFAERLAQVRRQNESVRREFARLDAEHARSLASLAGDLQAGGFSAAEATAEIRQRKATWKKEMETALAANQQRERAGEQKFSEVTGKMFRSLAHESFHAWLDAFVYPHERHHAPRWLDEGLAQVFESGQLDGDSLRLDGPDKGRLAALRDELAAREPLALAEVLTAGERQFLGPHGGGSPRRHYLFAWGLAHYLTFHENLLGSPRLDDYVSAAAQRLDPIARFERLVGRPLPEFERSWRAAMIEKP